MESVPPTFVSAAQRIKETGIFEVEDIPLIVSVISQHDIAGGSPGTIFGTRIFDYRTGFATILIHCPASTPSSNTSSGQCWLVSQAGTGPRLMRLRPLLETLTP